MLFRCMSPCSAQDDASLFRAVWIWIWKLIGLFGDVVLKLSAYRKAHSKSKA